MPELDRSGSRAPLAPSRCWPMHRCCPDKLSFRRKEDDQQGPRDVDAKIASSGSGGKPSLATHFSERYGVVRPYKPVGHRHSGARSSR